MTSNYKFITKFPSLSMYKKYRVDFYPKLDAAESLTGAKEIIHHRNTATT